MSIIPELISQFFRKAFTNPFPKKYAPNKVSDVKKINPPISVPLDYRGKIEYDYDKCIGCQLCVKVCPANAMEFIPIDKKIKHYVLRCCFCGQCVDVCPVKALSQSQEFLLANIDKDDSGFLVK